MRIIPLLCLLFPSILVAQPYHFSKNNEVALLGLGVSMELVGLYFDSKKSKPTRQSINQLSKNEIVPWDRFVAGNWSSAAATRSDIVLYSTLALPMLFPITNQSSFWELSLLYLETSLITRGGVSIAKGISHRHRPYAYDSNAPDDTLYSLDTKRSFFSGHVAQISASSVYFAKVFSDLYPNSEYKKPIWAGSGLVILYAAWQRMEAGMHFPSDVAVGMLWGGTVAYWVPEWHLKKRKVQFMPYLDQHSNGVSLSVDL